MIVTSHYKLTCERSHQRILSTDWKDKGKMMWLLCFLWYTQISASRPHFLALYILAKLIMVYVNFYVYRNPQGISSVHLVSHYTNWHCASCCDIYTKEIRYCQVLFVVLEYYHCRQFFVVILQYVLGKILFHLKPVYKKKALYLSVNVFSTKVLTGDTIFYVS